jgi:hypothetical protein
VRARLPYYRAPSHPQPMIYDQTAYSSPSVDQILSVWSLSDNHDHPCILLLSAHPPVTPHAPFQFLAGAFLAELGLGFRPRITNHPLQGLLSAPLTILN